MQNKQNEPKIKFVRTADDRRLLWLSPKMIRHLDFLLKQKPKPFKTLDYNGDQRKELKKVLKIFQKLKINVFCVDLTPDNFRSIGYFVYKVIIPALQPLYLNEERKEFRMERIRKASSYFKQKKLEINKIPHPFL
jgi:ribosomal protein S12 methylthiotransferase accessory factor YcaO